MRWYSSHAAASISTHAPAWGATCAGRMSTTMRCSFLLTPLRRGRPVIHDRQRAAVRISTHAPAWGATKHCTPYFSKDEQFLLTPPRRERPVKVVGQCTQDQFLLTPPHGGDEAYPSEIHRNPYFYSRPHVGGDDSEDGLVETVRPISTHAPE